LSCDIVIYTDSAKERACGRGNVMAVCNSVLTLAALVERVKLPSRRLLQRLCRRPLIAFGHTARTCAGASVDHDDM
jgi:hypothetical protein